jgi:hypothetical protein
VIWLLFASLSLLLPLRGQDTAEITEAFHRDGSVPVSGGPLGSIPKAIGFWTILRSS